jgi:hypothetical protein
MSEDTNVQGLDENSQDDSGYGIDDAGYTPETGDDTEGSEETVTPEPKKDEKEPERKQEERPTWTMPVAKAQEEKRKAVEKAREEARAEAEAKAQAEIVRLKKQMEEGLAKANPNSHLAKIEEVASKHGVDPELAKELLDAFKQSIEIPDVSKYEEILKEREIESYKLKASNEFDEKVIPLIKKDFPNVTMEHIADVKSKVTELAFSKGYNTYAIEDIYKVRRDDFEFKNGYSAESSGGRSTQLVDFSKMSDEEEHALAEKDPASYEKYIKAMSKSGSRYLD